MSFTLAAYLYFTQALAVVFVERPQVLRRCCCKFHCTLQGCQSSGNEKDFNIQPVAFWPVQTRGWNACVNLARQHKLQLGLSSLCRKFEEEGLGNIKRSYYCQTPHGWSWQPSCWSMLGMCFRWKCQAAWMEQMLMGWVGARNSTRNTHVLFLTFLIKRDNNITLFLGSQTIIFK